MQEKDRRSRDFYVFKPLRLDLATEVVGFFLEPRPRVRARGRRDPRGPRPCVRARGRRGPRPRVRARGRGDLPSSVRGPDDLAPPSSPPSLRGCPCPAFPESPGVSCRRHPRTPLPSLPGGVPLRLESHPVVYRFWSPGPSRHPGRMTSGRGRAEPSRPTPRGRTRKGIATCKLTPFGRNEWRISDPTPRSESRRLPLWSSTPPAIVGNEGVLLSDSNPRNSCGETGGMRQAQRPAPPS